MFVLYSLTSCRSKAPPPRNIRYILTTLRQVTPQTQEGTGVYIKRNMTPVPCNRYWVHLMQTRKQLCNEFVLPCRGPATEYTRIL